MDKLKQISSKLKSLKKKKQYSDLKAKMPTSWLDKTGFKKVNPLDYFLDIIESYPEEKQEKKSELYHLDIYNYLNYEHNTNTDYPFRANGTLLKAIAALPELYNSGVGSLSLRSLLEACSYNTDEYGYDPFAVKNYSSIDPVLGEDILEMSIEDQYQAFKEACSIFDIHISVSIPIDSPSIDSDLTLEKPEWFFWIKNNLKFREKEGTQESFFGPPIFLRKEIKETEAHIDNGEIDKLIIPHDKHLNQYIKKPNKVARVESKIIGLIQKKTEVTPAPRVRLWPLDTEVDIQFNRTLYRYYHSKEFNYLSYNTVVHYSKKLKSNDNKNEELWKYLVELPSNVEKILSADSYKFYRENPMPDELLERVKQEIDNLEKPSEFIDSYDWEISPANLSTAST